MPPKIAALLTRKSIPPKCSMAAAAMAATESWSAMSTRTRPRPRPHRPMIAVGGLLGAGLVDVGHHHRRRRPRQALRRRPGRCRAPPR